MAEEEVSLDDVRDFLYTALRSAERFTENLRKACDTLDKSKADDAWLELVVDEVSKGDHYSANQQQIWGDFSKRMEIYVDSVRKEADEMAMAELAVDGEAKPAKTSKFVHPELLKFKQEKIAKILGKYGGMPALGGGLILPRAGPTNILKATASPAAREIHYSKTENKDASELAKVIQFKVKKAEATKAQWQEEASAKANFGNLQLDGDRSAPATPAQVLPENAELSSRLADRAAHLINQEEQAEAARQAANRAPLPSGTPQGELAEKMRRRQSAVAAATPPPAEPDTPPPTTWSAASPYGNELSAAIARRQAANRVDGSSGSGETPGGTPVPAATPPPRPRAMTGMVPMMGSAATNELQAKLRSRAMSESPVSKP